MRSKPKMDNTYLITTHDANLPCGGSDGLSIQVLHADRHLGDRERGLTGAGVELFVDQASGHQDMVCSVVLTQAEARHLAQVILGTLGGAL